MIAVIDYGMGNVGSIANMLKYLGISAVITNQHEQLAAADKLILPGIGTIDKAMENLTKLNLVEFLNKVVLQDKKPILGICLGMQLMTLQSEEGQAKALGWFDAQTEKFNLSDRGLKVPHMRWNTVTTQNFPLFENLDKNARFYFVHSYFVKSNDAQIDLASTNYGHEFVSAIGKEHIIGVQFHPEKSHKYGMQLFENFVRNY